MGLCFRGDDVDVLVAEWIEAWYNPRRRHTSLGMLAPAEYEQQHRARHEQDLHTAATGAA